MSHYVKCIYCGERFDRDKEAFVQIGRRYSHIICATNATEAQRKTESDFEMLKDYIKEVYGSEANWALIMQTIKKYINEYNFTYSGIYRALKYWYEVKHNSILKSHGNIRIVEHIYNDAQKYYINLQAIRDINKEKVKVELEKQKETSNKDILIKSPERKAKKSKFFTFLDEEE